MRCDIESLRAMRKLLESVKYETLTAADKALYLEILTAERQHREQTMDRGRQVLAELRAMLEGAR